MPPKEIRLFFCTFSTEMDNTTEAINGYKWSLSRSFGFNYKNDDPDRAVVRRKIKRPSSNLGSGITLEQILINFNSQNCFDFKYTAREKDFLLISNTKKYPAYEYFSIVFTNGKWEAGPRAFYTIFKTIAKGKIKRLL